MMVHPFVFNNAIYNGDGVLEISRKVWLLTEKFKEVA